MIDLFYVMFDFVLIFVYGLMMIKVFYLIFVFDDVFELLGFVL